MFTVDRSTEEEPDSAPAASPWLRRRPSPWPPRGRESDPPGSSPPPSMRGGGYAPPPAQIRQVRAGAVFERRKRRFLAYSFPSRSPDPHHLAVLTRPGFVRAARHPPRHLPGQAALSFAVLLRQDQRRRSLTSTRSTAPHGARFVNGSPTGKPLVAAGSIGSAGNVRGMVRDRPQPHPRGVPRRDPRRGGKTLLRGATQHKSERVGTCWSQRGEVMV